MEHNALVFTTKDILDLFDNSEFMSIDLADSRFIGKIRLGYLRFGTSFGLQPRFHFHNFTLWSFHMTLNCSTFGIFHPSSQFQFGCLLLSILAEEDALDFAKNFKIT